MRLAHSAVALLLCLCPLVRPLAGQDLNQTVRGVIVDDVTRQPLPGANVAIAGTGLGAAAGDDGAFRIPRVPLGRYDIQV
ncbi:MAG: carboxypeptidase-like regulatory domain-containing protein, partial [Gemmatimonadota bacterium]